MHPDAEARPETGLMLSVIRNAHHRECGDGDDDRLYNDGKERLIELGAGGCHYLRALSGEPVWDDVLDFVKTPHECLYSSLPRE